jgi:hypothetical protein
VLILRAEKSWELTPERMPEVEATFSAADLRTVTIAGAVANLEVETPAEVAAAVREFVQAPVQAAASAGASA